MEKQTSSANRAVLRRILAQEGNNKCADCKTATHPRWASWNIGVLICIRCSGVHRSLGTHISKVRSIDLDTWNEKQLEKLVEFGNKKANAYWEAQLPDNYIPDESKIHNFIRTKYELKRWVPKDGASQASVAASGTSSAAKQAQKSPPLPPKTRSTDLLDLNDIYALKTPSSEDTRSASVISLQPSLSSRASSQASLASLYSQPPRASHQTPPPLSQQQPAQQQPAQQANRNDVKKSILSLYSQTARPTQPSPASSLATSQLYSSQRSSQTDLFKEDEDSISNVWK